LQAGWFDMGERLRSWLSVLAVVGFALGPAAGVAQALHLAEAGHQHDSNHCVICLDLTIGAGAAQVPMPVVIDCGVQSPTDIRPVSDEAPVINCPCQPLAARAPPT
jgi:hypothetical protein